MQWVEITEEILNRKCMSLMWREGEGGYIFIIGIARDKDKGSASGMKEVNGG